MKAVVYDGPNKVDLQDVADAKLEAEHGVVIEVEKASICGSDLHVYWGEFGDPAGVRPGHEFIGRVVEVGASVTRFKKGDKALVAAVFGCGDCSGCHHGDVVACENSCQIPGVAAELAGGQAEAAWVPHADFNLRLIPNNISSDEALLLTDVLPTGYYGAQRASVEVGDTVAIFGMGPIGLAALQSAQIMGAAKLIAIDTVEDRLQRARDLGAITVDATKENVTESILELTNGRGVDAVIEAVGVDQTINSAIDTARVGATVAIVGVSANFAFPIAPAILGLKNINLALCTTPIQSTWPTLLPLLENGRYDLERFFTHRYRLEQVAEAYDTFSNKKDACFKIMFENFH